MAEKEKPTVVEPQVMGTVYLKPKDINTFSMWHTAYVGTQGTPGQPPTLHRIEIVGGKIRGLPVATYERFRDAGILTTERPRRRGEDEE